MEQECRTHVYTAGNKFLNFSDLVHVVKPRTQGIRGFVFYFVFLNKRIDYKKEDLSLLFTEAWETHLIHIMNELVHLSKP